MREGEQRLSLLRVGKKAVRFSRFRRRQRAAERCQALGTPQPAFGIKHFLAFLGGIVYYLDVVWFVAAHSSFKWPHASECPALSLDPPT